MRSAQVADLAGISYRQLPEQLVTKIVETPDGCWHWTAGTNAGGYAQVKYQGKVRRAHIVVYEILVGPVPDGLELDHACTNKRCVRPHTDHVNACTHQENCRRHYAQAETCVNGHPWTDENTYRRPGRTRRECRACNRERHRSAA